MIQYFKNMMNQNAIFRQQLRRIAANINKKHKVLLKEIVKTCQVFQNQHLPVFPYQVCFGLFRHLPQANSINSCMLFLPFVQNIINLGFANQQMNREIIILLTHIKSLPKFKGLEHEVKVQQIIQMLVSKNAINLNNLPSTHAILNILIALSNQSHKNMWQKTLSIAMQISILHLNELADEENRRDQFHGYLMDLIRLARGESVKWLIEPPEQFIFMALLSQLLEENHFRDIKEEFKDGLVSMLPAMRKLIVKLFQGAQFQIPSSPSKHWELPIQLKLIICLRVACKINRLYHCSFELLQQLVKIMSEKSGPKGLSYQCINYLFASPQWMHTMLQSPSGDLFNFLMTTLFNTVKNIQTQIKESDPQRSQIDKYRIFSSNTLDISISDLYRLGEVRALVRSIDEITFTFFSIYTEIYNVTLDKKIEGKPALQKTYKFLHKTVFQIVKSIINKEVTQETLQSLLKISERIINLAGVFGDSGTAGVYIKLLCRYCMPAANQKGLGHRHVQINKMILNTANCLGNLFSTACWVTLWRAFQNYALYYNRYKLGREHLQAQRQNDVQILYASMETLFTQSPAYDDEYLQTILQSLVEVTYECLENTYTEETKKIFAFQRIQQVFRLNLHRIARIWPSLTSSLIILTTSKMQQYRIASLSLVNSLVPIALHYLHTHPEAIDDPFASDNYETVILEPWKQLSDSPFSQVRIELSSAVTKMVIDYGHILGGGWTAMLGIVRKLNDMTALQAIVDTYLDKIQGQIEQMVDAIDQVERSLSDPNQKYLCLTLIWAIGDHAYHKQMHVLLRKIYSLLLQPEQMFALGTEARNSSFYILAELLVHNCGEKQEEFWIWVFDLIDKFTNFVVQMCLEKRDRVSADEVLKNILTNLLKIYRKCFLVLEGRTQFLRSRVGVFFSLVTRFLQFRQPQVYQWTLKQVRQMLTASGELSLSTPQFWSFLQKLTQIYYVQKDNKILKVLITYLPIDIYDVLTHCLPKLDSKLPLLYKLVEKIFLIRLEAQEKQIKIAQLRIFFEDRTFIEFFRKLHNNILERESKELLVDYQQLFVKTLHKLLLYDDQAFLIKMLPFLSSLVEKHAQKLEYDQILDLISALLKERWSQSWKSKHSKSKDPPIWLVATHEAVRLGHTLGQYPQNQACRKGYMRMLTMQMDLLGMKPNISPQQPPNGDFLISYYDSESTMLYFIVENYLLNENGTCLVTKEQEEKLLRILKEEVHCFREGDKSARAKNGYDVLFKALNKRSKVSEQILQKQSGLASLLLTSVVYVLKGYSVLLSQGRATGSDLEAESKFLIKKMSQLQTGNNAFKNHLQWIKEHIGSAPTEQSAIWSSSHSLLLITAPLFHSLIAPASQDIRQLVSQCLSLAHSSLLTQLKI